MKHVPLIAVFLFSFATNTSFAGPDKYDLAPTDLQKTGLNKVLCMKNGSTVLFHFEPRKAITIKVFDSLHKEIASLKHLCQTLDINTFEVSFFKGLYDINGEAVLFIEQEHLSKKILVMVRFNATTGNVIEERVVGKSESMSRPTEFFVMKYKNNEGYSILYSADVPQFNECKVHVTFFNNRHEVTRDVPIDIDRKKYDYMYVVGAEEQKNGNCMSFCLLKLITNETIHNSDVGNSEAIYNHTLFIAFIPDSSNVVRRSNMDLSTTNFPSFTHFTFNPFSQTLNLLLSNYKGYFVKNGLDVQPIALKSSIFFSLDENTMSLKYNWMSNKMANVYYRQQTDTTKLFEGFPVKMFTNENGLSTIVYESYGQYRNEETYTRRNVYESFFGKIGITQCDDDGNELWGIVLPNAQYLKSYSHFYHVYDLSKRWQQQPMFEDLPEDAYNRQFVSLNSYYYHNSYYIIFNDYNSNLNNSMAHPGETVYSFTNTNACYYKLNRKKEVTKSFLFGEPKEKEFKSSFIEGADFDEQRGVYATLIQYNQDNHISLSMAWCHLE